MIMQQSVNMFFLILTHVLSIGVIESTSFEYRASNVIEMRTTSFRKLKARRLTQWIAYSGYEQSLDICREYLHNFFRRISYVTSGIFDNA